MNISGVPTFIIGSDVVVGLDKARVLELVDHRIMPCPECAQKIRGPVNKGQIEITCPKCSHKFLAAT